MIETILFDMDNTLLDRVGAVRAFARWQAEGMLRPYLPNPDAFAERFFELDDNGRLWKDAVYTQLLTEFEIDAYEMHELLSVYMLTFCAFCQPLAGAESAVRALKAAGYKLGVITNGRFPFQQRNLNALPFADQFDLVIVSAAVGLRKPDAAIFKLACQQLDTTPAQTIFVGDNPIADIQGANDVGMRSVFVPSFFTAVCPAATATCHDLHTLPAIVEGIRDRGSGIGD